MKLSEIQKLADHIRDKRCQSYDSDDERPEFDLAEATLKLIELLRFTKKHRNVDSAFWDGKANLLGIEIDEVSGG